MNKFRRFRKLSGSQKINLLSAITLLPMTGAALRILGFQRWKSFLAIIIPREIPLQPVTPEALQDAGETARMVAAAAREGVFRGKCLEKSTVLWFLLCRKRIPAELRIGVRRAANGLEAHAWVEVQGTIVSDTEDAIQSYVPFSENIARLGAGPQ
jgi:hypothetical protein